MSNLPKQEHNLSMGMFVSKEAFAKACGYQARQKNYIPSQCPFEDHDLQVAWMAGYDKAEYEMFKDYIEAMNDFAGNYNQESNR